MSFKRPVRNNRLRAQIFFRYKMRRKSDCGMVGGMNQAMLAQHFAQQQQQQQQQHQQQVDPHEQRRDQRRPRRNRSLDRPTEVEQFQNMQQTQQMHR